MTNELHPDSLKPYRDGYLYGYSQRQLEKLHADDMRGGPLHVASVQLRLTKGMTNDELGLFELGMYHGSYHARNGHPAPAASPVDLEPPPDKQA